MKMTSINIRNSEDEEDTKIWFPIPDDQQLNINDLRSAFPTLTSIRYRDTGEKQDFHVLCRDGIFIEPEGGWGKEGRVYIAISGFEPKGNSRFGIFESYRRQIRSNGSREQGVTRPLNQKAQTKATPATTTIKVGHGHFKGGTFSKISVTNLSGVGGCVVVGPFSKTGNTADEIKDAAFQKFCLQNRGFKRKYHSSNDFYLVYPDGTIVKELPDKTSAFSLEGYRNFLDPAKRFDRLRLYLCEKGNYELNNSLVEIITDSSSSSSEELPPLTFTRACTRPSSEPFQSTSSSTQNDDTLPLVVKVVFHYGQIKFHGSYPNNSKASVLFSQVYERMQLSAALKCADDKYINPDDRLLEITTLPALDVFIEVVESNDYMGLTYTNMGLVFTALRCVSSQTGEEEGKKEKEGDPIRAEYFDKTYITTVDNILKRTLRKLGDMEEPTEILRTMSVEFNRGRQMDVTEENDALEGPTSSIFIGRDTLWNDAITELSAIENLRFPLEVCFYGEAGEDLGGPRREFLKLSIREMQESLVQDTGNTLKRTSEFISNRIYFASGLLVGLSALQGGPCAPFLDAILSNYKEAEEYIQFKSGLKRVGIWQLIESKPTIRYLFRPRISKLSVQRLLTILQPEFSERGSNRRVKEERAYGTFVKYVRNVAAGRQGSLTLGSILSFVTGAEEEPVLGFSKDLAPNLRNCQGHCRRRLLAAMSCVCLQIFLTMRMKHFGNTIWHFPTNTLA